MIRRNVSLFENAFTVGDKDMEKSDALLPIKDVLETSPVKSPLLIATSTSHAPPLYAFIASRTLTRG
jgi:hypothetical protein